MALEINVSDNGYRLSRTSEDNLTTTFIAGDRIGLFAVANGKVHPDMDNICLTAVDNDGKLQWVTENNVVVKDLPGAIYYAYYPYTQSLNGITDATADNADDFFADIINNWRVNEDQSDYNDYTASDFMVAKGVLTDGTLSFGLSHKMALVRIILPTVSYVFTNTPAIAPYNIKSSKNISFTDFKPLSESAGEYRVLVNPVAQSLNLSGKYEWENEGRQWKVEANPVRGAVNTYTIDSEKSKIMTHELNVGDYFLGDGSLLSKNADPTEVSMSNVVGIVYTISTDRIGSAEKEALGGVAHGSVMAINDVKKPYPVGAWSLTAYDETEIGIPNTVGTTSQETADLFDESVSGYAVLKAIREKRATEFAAGNYEMLQGLNDFGNTTEGYENLCTCTTGWYMPTAGQWIDIVRNLGKTDIKSATAVGPKNLVYWKDIPNILSNINKSMEAVSTSTRVYINDSQWYWSATTESTRNAYMLQITDGGGVNSFSIFASSKSSYAYLRPVLTF